MTDLLRGGQIPFCVWDNVEPRGSWIGIGLPGETLHPVLTSPVSRALSLGVLCGLVGTASPAAEVVHVAGGRDWPMAYMSPDGRQTGFFVDVMREAASRAGLEFSWHFRDSLDMAMREDSIDVWAAASSTAQRKRTYYMSRPWWSYDHYVVVLAEGPIRARGDLAGKIVTYSNSPPIASGMKALFAGATMREVNKTDVMTRFCLGVADAALLNGPALNAALLIRPKECTGKAFRVIWQPPLRIELAIVAAFEKRQLAERLRETIDDLAADGTLSQIATRYPTVGSYTAESMLDSQRYAYRRLASHVAAMGGTAFLAILVTVYLRWRRWTRAQTAVLASANRALRAKEEFLALMSHEVRTPMNAVLGYMDLLQQTPLRADQRQFVQEVHHATWSLLSLFTDVLEYAKLQSDQVLLQKKPFLIEALVDDATAAVLLLAEDKNLELIARTSPRTPAQFLGDETRLRQIVVNLLSNALKFTSHGFVRLDLDYEADARPPMLVIRVCDTGIGIKDVHQTSIFEPFTQVEAPDHRRQGGAGLGLAIVSRLVKLMGGTIQLASAEGIGSRFEVRVPLEAPPNTPGWLTNYRQGVCSDVFLLARPSENVTILQEYLTEIGLRVIHFESTAQMLETIRTRDASLPLWGLIEESGFRDCPPATMAERLRVHPAARLAVADSLTATLSLPERDKEACHAVLSWPLGGRFLSGLLEPHERVSASAPAGVSVLVVDDNSVNRRIAMALLEGLGCQVELANHGKEAVHLAGRQEYSLILMDCQMPEMDGYEAARLIRSRQRPGSRTRIYGTSADGEDETRERCRKAGMDGFVDKPMHVEKLRVLLQSAAGERV